MSLRLSVVSHGQAAMAQLFLQDLERMPQVDQLVITENIPEEPLAGPARMPVIRHVNALPRGFADNHNQAFEGCEQEFFCVANPDIRLEINPFPSLLAAMSDPTVGVVAPLVLGPSGQPEDNARRFPTPANLTAKLMGLSDGRYHLAPTQTLTPRPVEWTAGMFLLFRSQAFRDVGGFDAKFHLYYEDVDICARLWKSGWKVMCDPGVTVIHHAQRASRHKPRYMSWHAASMARYFFKHLGRLPSTSRHSDHPPSNA